MVQEAEFNIGQVFKVLNQNDTSVYYHDKQKSQSGMTRAQEDAKRRKLEKAGI